MKINFGSGNVDLDEGALVMSADRFLARSLNSVDAAISIYVYGAKGKEKEVKEKLFSLTGSNGEDKDGYIYYCGKPFIERNRYTYADLIEVIKRLRDPDGCPWDRAQTHESIRGDAIEEAYELAEAVELNDLEKMREESGDVTLQGLFQASIAEEKNEFTIADTISDLVKKLVTRHTHIFGENKANNPEEALKYWEAAKAVEKGQNHLSDKLDSVPTTYSALMKANKIQKIVQKGSGFDYSSSEAAAENLKDEIEEFFTANGNDKEMEAGDILFSAVNVIRLAGIDSELALTASTNKFLRRFRYVEKKAEENGIELKDASMELMEEWYQEAKGIYENR